MKVNFDEFPDLQVPSFNDSQLLDIGRTGEESMRARIGAGVNVEGASAKPLAKNYATAKERRGLRPIRDLRFTGALLGSLSTERTGEDGVEIKFSDATQEAKAARLEAIEPMFGLSDEDVRNVGERAAKHFSENVERLNRK